MSVAYENGLLKVTVADNGKGVSPEKAKRLMQPFVQADIKNRTEGCGLGLAICRRLVEIAHGTISIETAPGQGFAIHTAVPTEVAPANAKNENTPLSTFPAPTPKLPKRILVVDDLPANRAVMKAILRKLGIPNVEDAKNGSAALEKLEKDSAFDLVMTDVWMPVLDGVGLVRRIRDDERLAHLKVCALTADVEALTTYKKQGFDMLLLKPVTLEKVTELFNNNL